MGRPARGWAIAAAIAVLIATVAIGYYAWMVARIVEESIRHPYTGTFAAIVLFVGLVLFGWTPVAANVLFGAWAARAHRFAGSPVRDLLPGFGPPVKWLWPISVTTSVLAYAVLVMSLWQGFAEQNRLPHWPVLAIQWTVLLIWLVTSLVIIFTVERRLSARSHHRPEPGTMPT